MRPIGRIFILEITGLSLAGCASDSSSHADNAPVDIAPDASHNQVYAAGATDPASYRQTLTDRAYDYSDPNNPNVKKGDPPLETYSQ